MVRNILKIVILYLSLFVLITCGGGGGGGGSASTRSYVYIDPSAGTNGNGTISSPYNTWSSVTFTAGTSYLQKRGTTAREQIIIDNTSGSSGSEIVIGAYGTGADPIIQGSEEELSGWTNQSGNIYRKSYSLDAVSKLGLGMVAEDGTVLNFITWNSSFAATEGDMTAGSFTYDNDNDIIYVWCSDNASPDTHTMEVSQRYFGIHGYNSSYINIENLHIRYASLHGISFEDSSNISVSNCKIEKLGGGVVEPTTPIYAGNAIEFGNASSNCSASSVTISDIFDSGFSPQTYDSNMNASNFTVSDSTISRCGFAGVEIVVLRNTDKENSSIDGVTVTNLTISDCGQGWSGRRYDQEGRGIKVSADIDGVENSRTIDNVVIRNCTVTGSKGEGIFIGGNSGTVTIERSMVSNNEREGILVQESGSSNLLLKLNSSIIRENGATNNGHGVAYNVPTGNGLMLYHNTIYDNDFLGLNIWSHGGTTTVITNNLFHSSSFKTHFYSAVALSGSPEINNNYFTEFGAGQNILNYNGTTYDNVADFNSGQSFAANNVGDTDPLLNVDLTLQSNTSPCYTAGETGTGVSTDYAGNAFRFTPSIGAYEY